LLKILSPSTVTILSALEDHLPAFHSISLVPFETVVYGFRFLVFGLFFLVTVNIKLRKREMISLVNIAVISAVIQVAFGFLKYVQGNRYFFLFFFERESYRDRLTGTLGNPDHFAFYLEMILPLALALFFTQLRFFERSRHSRSFREKFLYVLNENKSIIFYFTAAVLLGVGIILTGSRGGISTMILSIIIFALFSAYLKFPVDAQRKLKIIFIIIICIVVFIGVQNTAERFLRTQVEKELRFSVRWPGTITMVSDFPFFGTGFGTYRYSYYLYDNEGGTRWTTHAHNDYLETLSDGGIVGGVLFLALIGTIVISIFKMWRKRRHPGVKMLGLGIIVSFFAVIFHSIFDFSLRIPSNMFVLVLLLALGIKIVNHKKRDKREKA
jgi:O-antigen ligase